ncbi:hypothetical protein HJC23_001925 [Cyclotella cryptica]|uniref:tRNA-uridine aminocarboxypropyltransferase n=1 Tax=Cyclotella cryptica TaxID=29204 RepID=A0ABD3P3Q8_9STRA|eukprot:CCRYP_018041-RA/>CCRYP_018041-RA protein AED:0.00 eAED:0.00 QI:68/1/1/1/0/0/2/359/293
MSGSGAQASHTVQWERQSTWLSHLRKEKRRLQSSGVEGFDLLESMATLSIEHKLATHKDRCARCWHARLNCICSQLEGLVMDPSDIIGSCEVKILILMHHKEFMSAGNSAKLILQMFPLSTDLYIFGREGDIERLLSDVNADHGKTILLWPGSDSMSTTDLMNQINDEAVITELDDTSRSIHIRAIVLDGTYNQARNMYKSLKKKWGPRLPTAVSLRPHSASVFHRANKNYGKAHLQQQQSSDAVFRVSTAEACGVLLYELNVGGHGVMDKVTQAVKINNDALKYSRYHLTGD